LEIPNSDIRICLLCTLEESVQKSLKLEIEASIAAERSQGQTWVGSWTAVAVTSELAKGSTLVAFKVGDHALCAFLFFRPPGPFWEIMLVMTVLPYRGKRLAGELIDALFAHAESVQQVGAAPHDDGVEIKDPIEAPIEVGLEVRADNEGALRCYKLCGFSEQGRRKAYYPGPLSGSVSGSISGPTDAVLMSARRVRSSQVKGK
jgi:ribosomal protein S18 acetylase RimI-like enzyme